MTGPGRILSFGSVITPKKIEKLFRFGFQLGVLYALILVCVFMHIGCRRRRGERIGVESSPSKMNYLRAIIASTLNYEDSRCHNFFKELSAFQSDGTSLSPMKRHIVNGELLGYMQLK